MLLLIAFWVGTALLIFSTIKLWRVDGDHRSYQRPPWWLWGNRLWKGYRRTLLPASLVAVCFAIGLTVSGMLGIYFALAGLVVFFPLMVTVALFNRPAFLVPPASRDESGLLS
jgi:hypothetical protein